jgi:hypothetical protein
MSEFLHSKNGFRSKLDTFNIYEDMHSPLEKRGTFNYCYRQ